MRDPRDHPAVKKVVEQYAEGLMDRREFLRLSTMLGLSIPAAYAIVGKVTGKEFVTPAKAAMPMGGSLRLQHRVADVSNAHVLNWLMFADQVVPVCERLTRILPDGTSRPDLCESWEASEDLKSWTLKLRDVKWHNGRRLVADDVIWNMKHWLDPATGSNMLGLQQGYLTTTTGEGDDAVTTIWDANAIEKVDDRTLRLNLKTPQIAIPEHFYHYTSSIYDPEENGVFKAGSNGTGPFKMTEVTHTESATYEANREWWGEGPYLDEVRFIDVGDESGSILAALASKQVHGIFSLETFQIDAAKKLDHVNTYSVPTANTATLHMWVDTPPWDDDRVRLAVRYAMDNDALIQISLGGAGAVGEHHHVSPVQPEYSPMPFKRDIAKAKQLLADAGHPDGFDTEMHCLPTPEWMPVTAQAMKEMLADVGIRVKLTVLPIETMWEMWNKVPFIYLNWSHRPLAVMMLALAYRKTAVWNVAKWYNDEFEALLDEAEGLVDVPKRRAVVAKIQKLLQEEGPMALPFWIEFHTAYDKRVKGAGVHPMTAVHLENLAMEA